MELRHRNLVLALVFAVVIPVILVAIILVFMFIITPNVSNVGRQGSTNDATNVIYTESNSRDNNYIVLMGVICICVLIIIIIALILAVCFWSVYVTKSVSERNSSRECIVTSFTSGQNKVELSVDDSNKKTACERNDRVAPSFVNTQHKNTQATVNTVDELELETKVAPVPVSARPVSYGSLNRSRFLSSVDEDGFHIDNFGLEDEEDGKESHNSSSPHKRHTGSHKMLSRMGTLDSFDENILRAVSKLEMELNVPEAAAVTSSESGQCGTTSSSDYRRSAPPGQLVRQLSRKESSFSLPPIKAYDNYLSLVDQDLLDSSLTCPNDSIINEQSDDVLNNK